MKPYAGNKFVLHRFNWRAWEVWTDQKGCCISMEQNNLIIRIFENRRIFETGWRMNITKVPYTKKKKKIKTLKTNNDKKLPIALFPLLRYVIVWITNFSFSILSLIYLLKQLKYLTNVNYNLWFYSEIHLFILIQQSSNLWSKTKFQIHVGRQSKTCLAKFQQMLYSIIWKKGGNICILTNKQYTYSCSWVNIKYMKRYLAKGHQSGSVDGTLPHCCSSAAELVLPARKSRHSYISRNKINKLEG